MTIHGDSHEEDGSETQAATVDFSAEVSLTSSIAAAATSENGEAETKFTSSMAAPDDTFNHLQSDKTDMAEQYSKFMLYGIARGFI